MLRYAITDRKLFATRQDLLDQAARWAAAGVDFIQIREKDLEYGELTALTAEIVHVVCSAGATTKVLLNGPAEIALETGCDGVHLPSGLPGNSIAAARSAFSETAIISVSCHTRPEIEIARDHRASLILFAPVFEKRANAAIVSGQGLAALAAACRAAAPVPVIALGGITALNAADCMDVGAAGIAAIRLFLSEDWGDLRRLRPGNQIRS